MKKTAIALGFLAMTVPLSSALADVDENRDVGSFSKVEFDGLMDVTIEVGKEQSVTITANNEKALTEVSTRVRGDTLVIDMNVERGFFSLFKDTDIEVHITVPNLEEVDMEGFGSLNISDLDADNFRLDMDGMGSIKIDGTCGRAVFDLDGLGDLNARNLKCKSVKLTLDGMGDAEIYASEYAEVSLDGMGNADVYGNPKDSRYRTDGMGDVDER